MEATSNEHKKILLLMISVNYVHPARHMHSPLVDPQVFLVSSCLNNKFSYRHEMQGRINFTEIISPKSTLYGRIYMKEQKITSESLMAANKGSFT